MNLRAPLLCTVSLALVCCQSSNHHSPATPRTPVDEVSDHAQPVGTAPTPYSSAEIAAAHPVDTFTEYRLTSPGQPPLKQHTHWTSVDSRGCATATTIRGADGRQVGPIQKLESEWWQLRDHAALPEKNVTVSEVDVSTEAGDFECWLYTHVVTTNGETQTMKLWFNKASAGSPVLLTTAAGGVDQLRMELLSTNRLPQLR